MRIARATKGAVERVVRNAFGKELHHLQALSMSMIVMGIIRSDRLGVSAVGRAMAQAYRKQAKHGIKQVDRFLSNKKLSLEDELFALWVPLVVGPRNQVLVAMDWTDFDNDDHTTLSLSLITREGRTVPLVWLSVYKSKLKGRRNAAERRAVQLLRLAVPAAVHVVIVADRGFDDTKLYRYLTEKLGFDFIIRFRGNIHVHYKDEELWPAKELVPRNGRIRVLLDTVVTANCSGPWNVVLHKARGMKDSWCLVTSVEPGRGDVSRPEGPAIWLRVTIQPDWRLHATGPLLVRVLFGLPCPVSPWAHQRDTWIGPTVASEHSRTADAFAISTRAMVGQRRKTGDRNHGCPAFSQSPHQHNQARNSTWLRLRGFLSDPCSIPPGADTVNENNINSDQVRAKAKKFIGTLTTVLGVIAALMSIVFLMYEGSQPLKDRLSYVSGPLGAALGAWFGGNWVYSHWQATPRGIMGSTIVAAVVGFAVGFVVGTYTPEAVAYFTR